MIVSKENSETGIKVAHGIADWLCAVQSPANDMDANAGRIPILTDSLGYYMWGNQWNIAFAIMGWLAAYEAFDEKRYLDSAISGGRYLKTLQIFDPFNKKHYGAIHEMTPQTPWCYPRDGLSAAWAFIELYRVLGDEEYLERACLWGEWFLREGCDEDGWPYWGVQFEDFFEGPRPQICNDMHACCHGGCLNFLYQLAKVTGDLKWTGGFFINMADYFVDYIQQPDGFFNSIMRSTRKPPSDDPLGGLHQANDDFGTLGLLCAYRVTGDEKYLRSIEKFLSAVFSRQQEDGMFEESVACIPVIMNILHEAGDEIAPIGVSDIGVEMALGALWAARVEVPANILVCGALYEKPNIADLKVCARANCYALIVLLKMFAGIKGLLTASE